MVVFVLATPIVTVAVPVVAVDVAVIAAVLVVDAVVVVVFVVAVALLFAEEFLPRNKFFPGANVLKLFGGLFNPL